MAKLFSFSPSLTTTISSPLYEEELAEVVGLVEADWVEGGLVEVGWLETGWVGIDGVESGMVVSDVVVASDSFVVCRSLVLYISISATLKIDFFIFPGWYKL